MDGEELWDKAFDGQVYRSKSDIAYRECLKDGNKERTKAHNIIDGGGLELSFALNLAKMYFNTTPQGKALDIGCGWGYMTYCLKEFGFDAIGFDINQDAIEIAKNSFPEITCFVGDGTTPQKYFNHTQFDLIHVREFHPFTRIDNFGTAKTVLKKEKYPFQRRWTHNLHTAATQFVFVSWKNGWILSFRCRI